MTSHFQDGGHHVRLLPASPPSVCDVIGSVCAQHSQYIPVCSGFSSIVIFFCTSLIAVDWKALFDWFRDR